MDLQLAHHLAPAKAPDELWLRVSGRKPAPHRAPHMRWLVPAAAIAACVAALLATPRPIDLQHLAAAELRSGKVEFASADPSAISAWLRREAGVNASLRNQNGVRLVGARVVRHGVGAVSCRIDGQDGAVLIALGHERSACKMPGHTVAVAATTPDRAEALCRMCHSL
jgi:hypothetical protein